MSGVKLSAVHELHELLIESVVQEMKQCKADNIPLAGPLMNTALAILKMNNITAEPDETKLSQLRDEFSAELAAARSAKAKTILDSTDVLDQLMN